MSILVLQNNPESENYHSNFFGKKKFNQRTVHNSSYFKNLKETAIVIKESTKKPWFFGFFHFFEHRNIIYIYIYISNSLNMKLNFVTIFIYTYLDILFLVSICYVAPLLSRLDIFNSKPILRLWQQCCCFQIYTS